MATHQKEIFYNLDFFFLTNMEKQRLQTEFALQDLVRRSCCLHYPAIYEMLPKFGNQTDMHVCLLKFGISAYFFF